MKRIIFYLIIYSILVSCLSIDENRVNQNEPFGLWKVDSIEISTVHAVINTPKINSIKIHNDFINPSFELKFKKDKTFVLQNLDGAIHTGHYEQNEKSIILKDKNCEWLFLKARELTSEYLKYEVEAVRFYTEENDTIRYFTGDSVKIRMKKHNNNAQRR